MITCHHISAPYFRVVAGVLLICVGLAATAGVTITSPDFSPVGGGRTVPKARVVAGVALICVGLAATAGVTITSPDSTLGIRVSVVAAPFVGAALMGFGPIYNMIARRRKKRDRTT